MEEKLDMKKFAEVLNVDYATLPQEKLKEKIQKLEDLKKGFPKTSVEAIAMFDESIADIQQYIK